MALKKAVTTVSAGAQNIWSDPVQLEGDFNLSISGTWAGTTTVQRSFDKSNWMDLDPAYTANTQQVGTEPESDVWYRIGIKTGEYTSGTMEGRLSQ